MRGRREASQKVLAGQQPVPFANEDQLGPLVLPLSARSREASTELKVQLQKQRFLTNQDLMRLAGQDGVPGSPGLSILFVSCPFTSVYPQRKMATKMGLGGGGGGAGGGGGGGSATPLHNERPRPACKQWRIWGKPKFWYTPSQGTSISVAGSGCLFFFACIANL